MNQAPEFIRKGKNHTETQKSGHHYTRDFTRSIKLRSVLKHNIKHKHYKYKKGSGTYTLKTRVERETIGRAGARPK